MSSRGARPLNSHEISGRIEEIVTTDTLRSIRRQRLYLVRMSVSVKVVCPDERGDQKSARGERSKSMSCPAVKGKQIFAVVGNKGHGRWNLQRTYLFDYLS